MTPPLFPLPPVPTIQFDGYSMVNPIPVYVFSATDEEEVGEGVGVGFEAAVGVALALEPPVLQATRKNATNKREQNAISRFER